jgi:tetratricopeptide (TPR) repeat protein
MKAALARLCVAALMLLAPQPGRYPVRADPASPEQSDKLTGSSESAAPRSLDVLFQALKAAPDGETARRIEGRIWALWLSSGSETADLLMSRVRTAIEQNDPELALQLLDAIVDLKPDYVEAWNRRATLYFEKHDYGRAMSDIARVLALEPRHFGALTGLGMILEDIGDDRRALQAFRRALDIDPHLGKVPDLVKSLTEKVEGRGI